MARKALVLKSKLKAKFKKTKIEIVENGITPITLSIKIIHKKKTVAFAISVAIANKAYLKGNKEFVAVMQNNIKDLFSFLKENGIKP